jgi:hypothetical protein
VESVGEENKRCGVRLASLRLPLSCLVHKFLALLHLAWEATSYVLILVTYSAARASPVPTAPDAFPGLRVSTGKTSGKSLLFHVRYGGKTGHRRLPAEPAILRHWS